MKRSETVSNYLKSVSYIELFQNYFKLFQSLQAMNGSEQSYELAITCAHPLRADELLPHETTVLAALATEQPPHVRVRVAALATHALATHVRARAHDRAHWEV